MNFNAVFCKMIILMGYWWTINCFFILFLGLKGSKFWNLTYLEGIFSSPFELLSPLSVRQLTFHIFNQLLWSHWTNLNQTLVEWSLDDPLPNLCPMIPTSNQDGHQAKNRKKWDEILIVPCCFSISQNELKF